MTKPYSIIILPGWGGSHETWHDFVTLLAPQVSDVRVIDLPCFGTEPCPKEVWGIPEYAAFVEKKIQDIPPEKRVILGHSFGGQVAAFLVSQNPSVCAKLILSGAAIFRPKRRIKRYLFGGVARVGKVFFSLPYISRYRAVAERLLYRAADSPDYQHTKQNPIQQAIFQQVTRASVDGGLSHISVPTLLLWGTHDTYVPIRFGKKIAARIPHATFVSFQGGTHGLHRSKPQEMVQEILLFLS